MPQRPVGAGVDRLLEVGVERVSPLIEHHRQRQIAALVCDTQQFAHLLCVDAGGFFEQDVDAALERLNAHLRVLVMRGGDDDRLHLAGTQQLAEVGEQRDAHLGRQLLVRLS